jgi:hypothetical protein
MGSHCSFGHLKHKLWPKEGPGVELPGVRQFWLPTTKSQESTRNTSLQKTCDIPVERSRRDLQLCFRRQINRSFAPKVIRLQSRGSPAGRDFGTPARESWESRDKMSIWMPPPRRVAEYTIGSMVVAYSRARGVVCPSESECSWLVPTPKGPKMDSNQLVLVCDAGSCNLKAWSLPSLISGLPTRPSTPF